MTWADTIIAVGCAMAMVISGTLSVAYIGAAIHPQATWPQTRKFALYAGLYAAPCLACAVALRAVL